jgi:hypothetical protein
MRRHTRAADPASNLECTQIRTQKSGNSCHTPALADLCAKFVEDVNVSSAEELSHVLASLVTSWQCDEMAARAGIEPVLAVFQACADAAASEIEKSADAQTGAQKLAELQEVITAWPKLPPELRTACLAVTRSVR